MAELVWSKASDRIFHLGVDRGVFYPYDQTDEEHGEGVVWNGLVNVTESPEGDEDNKQYADNDVYANIRSAYEFGASIEAFTYPDAFAECDGSAQPEDGVFVDGQLRKPFGFSYRTKKGNNNDNLDYGYEIHFIWLATPSPSEKSRDTINESPEAATFSWDLTTERMPVTGLRPTAHMWVDSTKVAEGVMASIEALIYGGDSQEATLPSPDELIALVAGD